MQHKGERHIKRKTRHRERGEPYYKAEFLEKKARALQGEEEEASVAAVKSHQAYANHGRHHQHLFFDKFYHVQLNPPWAKARFFMVSLI